MFTYQGGRRQDRRCTACCTSRRTSIPTKKYPVLVRSTAARHTNGARETFATPSPLTEYGFLVAIARLAQRTPGRGKTFLDAIYLKLGVDRDRRQAAGVKALWDRPYVDKTRVGIFGTSYGGYASVDGDLLRHPDVFPAASRLVAADRLAQLRHDLHRALHVDSRRRTRTATTRAAR